MNSAINTKSSEVNLKLKKLLVIAALFGLVACFLDLYLRGESHLFLQVFLGCLIGGLMGSMTDPLVSASDYQADEYVNLNSQSLHDKKSSSLFDDDWLFDSSILSTDDSFLTAGSQSLHVYPGSTDIVWNIEGMSCGSDNSMDCLHSDVFSIPLND